MTTRAQLPASTQLTEDFLRQHPGWGDLEPAEQRALTALARGQLNPLSRRVRSSVMRMVMSGKEATSQNVDTLRGLLDENRLLSGKTHFQDIRTYDASTVEVGTPEPVQMAFHGTAELDALRYPVQLNGRTIDIVIPVACTNPNHETGLPSIEVLTEALSRLTPFEASRIQTIHLNPSQNPDNQYWSKNMTLDGFRSSATAHHRTGNITFYPGYREDIESIVSTLVHEAGHLISIPGSDSPWSLAAARDGVGVSLYGNENANEDLAEFHRFRRSILGTPEQAEYEAIYPNRFRLMEEKLNQPVNLQS